MIGTETAVITPIGFTSDGAVLRGALHLPEGSPAGGFPLVVLAQGLGTLHEWTHRTAGAFVEAGIAALTVDYRGFGISEGEPRQQAEPWKIVHDLRAAIDFATTRPEIDAERIGIWGTSFGGGPAMVAAAVDLRVKALALQAPVASGYGLMKAITPPEVLADLGKALNADRVAIVSGLPPVRLVQTSIDPADGALAADEDTYSWMTEESKATPHWVNQLTFQTVDRLLEFEPGDYLPRFGPRPVLLMVVDGDTINPPEFAVDAFERVEGPKKLIRLAGGGHYSIYREHFTAVTEAARDWFRVHLAEAGPTGW
jgi:alpha-beta hydrolase superfamily lysophospholipase